MGNWGRLKGMVAALLLLVIMAGQVSWVEGSGQKREIVVACSNENYPFHYADSNGKPAGINIDFWNLWSRKTGIRVRYLMSDWETSLQNMKEKKADVHAGCFFTEERDVYMDYGFPVTEAETHIFYDVSLKPIDSLEGASPYAIGVVKGDYAEGFVRANLEEGSVRTYASYDAMIDAAAEGKLRVYVADTLTALNVMERILPEGQFQYVADRPLYKNYFYVAVQEGEKDLLSTVNDGMSRITEEERKAILAKWLPEGKAGKKTVTVAISPDYAPFSFPDSNGDPRGFLVDLWRLWGKKANYEVRFVMAPWTETLELVKNGGADIHSGLFYTEDRAKQMDFTRPFYAVESKIYYKGTPGTFKSIGALDGRLVGTSRGSFQETYLKENYPTLRTVSFDSSASMIEAAENRLIDAFIEEALTVKGMYQLSGKPFAMEVLPAFGFSRDMMAATGKNRTAFLKEINAGLNAITEEEWRVLEEKWIPDPGDRHYGEHAPLALTEEEKDWIKAHPVLKIGVDRTQNPIEYQEGDEARGIAMDYMRYILDRIGIVPEVSFREWKDILAGIREGGDLDASFGIQRTDERSEYLAFSHPYARIPHVVVTKGDRKLINTLEDLSGLTVAVEAGFYKVEHFKKNNKIRLLQVNDTPSALLAVSTGRADAYVGDKLTVSHYVEANSLKNFRISDYIDLGTYNVSAGFRKDMAPLGDIINKVLDTMTEAEKKNILSKYSDLSEEGIMDLTDAERVWLRNHSPIRTGMPTEWAPIAYINGQGEFAGVASDYSARIERQLGVQLTPIMSASYSELIGMMRTGKLDVLAAAVKSPEKSKYMDFTKPYMRSPVAIITLDSSNFVGGLDNIAYERIGVVQDSYAEDVLRQHYAALSTIVYRDETALYEALSAGKVDMILDSIASIDYMSRKLHLSNLRVSSITEYVYEIGFAVRKDWPMTLQLLNRLVDTVTELERDSSEKYWFSQLPPEGQFFQRYRGQILAAVSALLLLLGLIIFWNRRLQQEINERKLVELELKAAKEAADSANRSKSEFLANMSHEIRTPMNAVIGMATLMGRTGLSDKQRDYLSKILQAAYNLLSIINDILDFSKIEAGRMSVEHVEFDLNVILDNVASITGIRAKEKDLELIIGKEPDVPMRLIGDPLRLEQVLINLTSNAIKFTETGEVALRISCTPVEETRVMMTFSVRDTGIGMADEQLAQLFQPFTQSDASTTRRYGGTGLGLSISRKLVELMGGRIWAMCKPGEGCVFSFEIPFRFVEGSGAGLSFQSDTLAGLRVLVVEDNPTAREVMERYLKDFRLTASSSDSGEQALQAVSEATYDLVLMDWKLTGIDGLETIRRMRTLNLPHPPKVVMVTAYGESELVEAMQSQPVDGLLMKPVSESALFNEIQNLFGGEGSRMQPYAVHHSSLNDRFLSGYRFLVVEDNAMNQQVALELLTSAGGQADIAANGLEALQRLEGRAGDYQLILMDLQMPQMDGFEASDRIRGMEAWRDTPILAMTADVLPGIYERCIQHGMNDYISKPVNIDELYEKLGFWLSIEAAYYEGTSGEHDMIPALTGVDSRKALKNLGGNRELYLQVLARFAEAYRDYDQQVAAFAGSWNTDAARRYFHTLRGHGGSVGSEGITQGASAVERLLTQEGGGLDAAVERLGMLVKGLVSEILQNGALPEPPKAAGERWTLSELDTLLEDLIEALKSRKPKTIQTVLDRLSEKQVPESHGEALDRIVTGAELYRYKEALASAEALLKALKNS